MQLAGIAASGEEALASVAADPPDIVVMDLPMPGIGGIEATRRLIARDPALPVLVLTMHDDESVFTAIRSGARGYLLKDAGVDELVRAVIAVRCGEAIFSPSTARRLLDHFAGSHGSGAEDSFPELTSRERDVPSPVGYVAPNSMQLGCLRSTLAGGRLPFRMPLRSTSRRVAIGSPFE